MIVSRMLVKARKPGPSVCRRASNVCTSKLLLIAVTADEGWVCADASMSPSQEAEDLRHSAKDDTVRSGHAGTGSLTARVLEAAPCFVLLDFRYFGRSDGAYAAGSSEAICKPTRPIEPRHAGQGRYRR